jgi:uncharacterized membrane protein YeaQ/YmgE (transglycosylase-associated protein family)
MNTVTWLLAGAILGWLGYTALKANVSRGMVLSIVIGAMSAYFGGSVLATLFTNTASAAGGFSPFALLTACATAGACLLISDMVYERFGV